MSPERVLFTYVIQSTASVQDTGVLQCSQQDTCKLAHVTVRVAYHLPGETCHTTRVKQLVQEVHERTT